MKIKKAMISITVISSILITGCTQSQKEVNFSTKPKTIHHETHKQISSIKIPPQTSKKNTNTINNTPSKPNDNFFQIVITDDSKGWALSNKKVFKKDHNKWVDVTPPEVKMKSIDVALQLYALNQNLVWVTYGDNIFNSQNGGKTWRISKVPKSPGSYRAYRINFSFTNSKRGWMLVHRGYGLGHSPFDIYQTTNQGISWKLVYHVGDNTNTGIPDTKDPSNITFLDEKHGFITGQGNDDNEIIFYKTNDAGKSWSLINIPLKANIIGFRAPQFFNQKEGILQVDIQKYNNGTSAFFTILYSTNNQGQTWKQLKIFNGTGEITFFKKNMGWANIRKSLNDTNASTNYKTFDGGKTWRKISVLKYSLNSINFSSPQMGWGLNDLPGQLMQSKNSGVTWEIVPR